MTASTPGLPEPASEPASAVQREARPPAPGVWRWRPASGRVSWEPGAGAADLFPLRGSMAFGDWLRLIHAEDRAQTQARLEGAARDGGTFRLRFRARGWTREARWVEGEGTTRLEQGAVTLVAVLRSARSRPVDHAAEERFRVAIDSMIDPFGIYRAVRDEADEIVDFEVVHVNGAACRATGLGREAQVGRRLFELVPALRSGDFLQACREVVRTGRPLSRESQLEEQDAAGRRQLRLVDIRASRLGDGLVVVWRDVTRQRWIERELQAANDFLQTLIRHSPAAIFARDLEGRFLLANELTRKAMDLPEAGVVGRTAHELGVPPDAPWSNGDDEVIVADGPMESEEMVRIDGEPRRFHVARFPLHEPHGRITSVGVIATDMTEYHRVLERLEESEARLRLATGAATIGIWNWDLRSDAIFWSAEMLTLVGRRQPARTAEEFMQLVHPEDVAGLRHAMKAALEDRTQLHAEFRVRRPDGSTRWLLSVGRADYADDQPVRMLGINQDITDTKLAQAAQAEAQRRKDDFLAVLSHELRNFLAPIRYVTAMLTADLPAGERAQASLGVLRRQVGHLDRLVADMLDVSRIQAGKLEMRFLPVPLGDVIRGALEAALPVAQDRGQRVDVEGAELSATVMGDSMRLCQALTNLLLNASKYTAHGGRIRVRATADEARATIEVRDEGAGFAPEMAPRLFDLYEQARSGEHGGLGIGLHLVRHILEQHGGGARGHSEGPGRGSTFTIWLPLATRT